MLCIRADHSNNCQKILTLLGYDIFCNNLQHKKIQVNLEVSEVLITYLTNRGKARVMLHIEAGHSNNCQIILKCSDMTYFAIICSTKKFQANLEVSEVLITYVTNRLKAGVTLHIGIGHSNNCQIILKLFRYDIFCNNLQQKKISSKFGCIRGY